MSSIESATVISGTAGAAANFASAVGADTIAQNLRDIQSTADGQANLFLKIAEMQAGDAAAQFGVMLPGQEDHPIFVSQRAAEAGADLSPSPPPEHPDATREESDDE